MKQVNVKKLILPNIPYVFIALLATKVSEAVRLAPGSDASTKLLNIMTGLNTAFHSLVPSFHPIDLCVGVAAAIAIRLAVYIKGKNAKKFRKNLEYGSARWGTAEDIKPYVDPAFENNIILTQTERLTMNSRPKDPKTARNKSSPSPSVRQIGTDGILPTTGLGQTPCPSPPILTHGVLTASAIWPSTAIPVWSICFSARPAKPMRRSGRKPLSGTS